MLNTTTEVLNRFKGKIRFSNEKEIYGTGKRKYMEQDKGNIWNRKKQIKGKDKRLTDKGQSAKTEKRK